LKRLFLLFCLAVLFTPYLASAQDWRRIDDHPHRRISAAQMATGGLVLAALIGVAGYLALRRRHTA
jgi:MYXO-CTERM domain-containing protein